MFSYFRGARERERVRAWSRGRLSVSWGRCVFSLLPLIVPCVREGERAKGAHRVQEIGEKCRVSMRTRRSAEFLFVQTHPLRKKSTFASHLLRTKRVVSFFSLSRDCESKRVRKLKCNAQCSTLCTAFAHPPPPPSSFCFILGVVLLRFVGCWGFVGILEKVMSMKGHCRKKKRNRKEWEWETTQNDAEIWEQRKQN